MGRTGDASALARRRLSGFSGAVTVVGLIIILVVGIVIFANGGSAPGVGSTTGGSTSEDFYYPWEDPDATAAGADGETWSGRGQQYIPLTGLTRGVPLVLTFLDEESEFSDFFLTPGAVGESDDAVSFHSYSDVGHYLVPSETEMTLWPRVRTTDPWTVRVKPAGLDERSGTVSATQSTSFVYTGPATAARVTVSGHASIEIVTEHGVEDSYPWFEDDAQSIAWPDTTSAVFLIDSSGDSSWSIQFYEPVPQPTEQPTETPTPAATESGVPDD